MALLLPFQALRYIRQPAPIFVPGEEPPPPIDAALLMEEDVPSLYIYQQHFEHSIRTGVMGLLNRATAKVYPHEETIARRVDACRNEWLESSSIFLWCKDGAFLLPHHPPLLQVVDRFDCSHTIWQVSDPDHIEQLQAALGDQPLFIADGHHRFAAGWNLATVQVRTPALHTHTAHRLIFEAIDLPGTEAILNLDDYWANTQRGHVRFGVVMPDGTLRGIELPHFKSERNVAVLRRLVLGDRPFQTARTIEDAMNAVRTGEAKMAFLLGPLSVDKIELDASKGVLLPPKSSDFYPKLAGGMIMHRHQNENVSPAVAQRPGVRNPSS